MIRERDNNHLDEVGDVLTVMSGPYGDVLMLLHRHYDAKFLVQWHVALVAQLAERQSHNPKQRAS